MCDIHLYTEKRVHHTPGSLKAICLQFISRLMINDPAYQQRVLISIPSDMRELVLEKYPWFTWEFIHEKQYNQSKPTSRDKMFADYSKRNYLLFGILSNVRKIVPDPVADGRGIPEDVSEVVKIEYKKWYAKLRMILTRTGFLMRTLHLSRWHPRFCHGHIGEKYTLMQLIMRIIARLSWLL
jgi:hypothetical protein